MCTLMTSRLRLEPLSATQAPMVIEALQAPSIYTYLPENPPTLDELKRRYTFLEGGTSPDGTELWLNWLAFCRTSNQPIGTFQATLPKKGAGSVAYIVFPAFWRQGYAREMMVCVVQYLFDTYDTPSLFAEIDSRNSGSLRLVESVGFRQSGIKKDADFFKGASSDEYTYAISRGRLRERVAFSPHS